MEYYVFNMITSVTEIFAHISHSLIQWIQVSKMYWTALYNSSVHEELFIFPDMLKQKQTQPMCLYFTMIKPKHNHNLRGICGQSFGCLKSQFRSKLSCMAVSIPKIIGAAFPYISCISWVLWRPTCFRGGCAASSEPAKHKVIKLQWQYMSDLFPWGPTALSCLVLVHLYAPCTFLQLQQLVLDNSTEQSPSLESNTQPPNFPASLQILWQYGQGLHSPGYDALSLGTLLLSFPRHTVLSSARVYRSFHLWQFRHPRRIILWPPDFWR